MKQEMHDYERVETCSEIVYNDADTFGEPFQSPDWERFQNIEDTEEYKAREKRFPGERDGNERDELARDFVDHDELGIF